VVISVMAEQRCYFLNSLRYPSPRQRSEAVDEARPPRIVAKIGGFNGAGWECSTEATSEQRVRRPCVCSLMVIAHGGGVQVAT
jgi:hypothetical protein